MYTFADKKRAEHTAPKKETAPAQPSLDALRSGAAKPTAGQMGRRVDLPEAMRAKMEESFGADLSAVKLYESEAVGAAGAEAVAQGSNIAFAPGMLDFTSFGGQALLGHEISHVVSQSRGEVTGGGFLNDHVLEARADREGAMAAAGQQIAMPAAALSTVSAAPSAGPMQAKKSPEKQIARIQKKTDKTTYASQTERDKAYYKNLGSWIDSIPQKKLEKDPALREAIFQETLKGSRGAVDEAESRRPASAKGTAMSYGDFNTHGLRSGVGDSAMGAFTKLVNKYTGDDKSFLNELDEDADASIARYQERVAGSETATDLLTRFNEGLFKGTDFTEEQRSRGLMNSLYNHRAGVTAAHAQKTGDRSKMMQANSARRNVGIDDSGNFNSRTTETGKGFLDFLVGRKSRTQ